MIATQNQQATKTAIATGLANNHAIDHDPYEQALGPIKSTSVPAQLFLPSRIVTHHPKAGLNPLADAAAYLFTVLGKLKQLTNYRQLSKLQKELIQEITTFQEGIKNLGYNSEYLVVCRYAICATFDDIISNTSWGAQGQWESFSLLNAFNQDTAHHEKFFTILDRAIKEPALYIDLMELMYICLSMGYKGQYRTTQHNQYQLDLITNNLYKHIRAFRGSFSKTLSPVIPKAIKTNIKTVKSSALSPIFILIMTACIVMTIFVSLSYLMDVISNEAYKNITRIEKPILHKTVSI